MHDIDVLIELKDLGVLDLRQKLQEFSGQFALAGIKLYYVKARSSHLSKILTSINLKQTGT